MVYQISRPNMQGCQVIKLIVWNQA